eukprot:6101867-Lingulodinium_polyedra.AAC.1
MPARGADQQPQDEVSRQAEDSDFPKLIPLHAGSPTVFSARRWRNDGQLWGPCDACARFVNGE